jgi:hypothetical protein
MAASIQVVVDFNKFGAISRRMQQGIDDALDTAMLTIVNVADPITPVDTGALRANKTLERDARGATVSWNQEYAAYQELGTIYIAPVGFARAGLEAAEGPFLDALSRIIEGG